MSIALPIAERPVSDFLLRLLQEQSELTAVERFSAAHDAGMRPSTSPVQIEPAQARYYRSLLPATPPEAGQQYSFEVDLDACSGCKACVVACHTLNGLDDHESWRRVGTLVIGEQRPQIRHVTTACHHCAEPGCLQGCPVKAYEKDAITGIVRHLDDQCIGCKYCTMMCPYEVPTYSHRLGIVRKCDMCHQRLAVGEAPACVQACPNAAIAIRLVDRHSAPGVQERLSPGAPPSTITRPTTRYRGLQPEQFALATAQDAGMDRPADSHWPLALMLVATQVSVGLLAAERLVVGLSGIEFGPRVTFAAVCLACGMAAIGLGLATLHLGQPLRAWRIFLGLGTSWLSREAVLFGKYMGLLVIALVLLLWPQLSPWLSRAWTMPDWLAPAVLTTALAVGVAGLISSGMIYVATSRQLWNASRTLTRFIGSSLAAGPLGLSLVLLIAAPNRSGGLTAVLLLTSGVLSASKLGWEYRILLGRTGPHDSDYDRRSKALLLGPLRRLRTVRLWAGIAGCILITLAATLTATASGPLALSCGVFGMLALLIGETCERLLYFSSVVYDRMPGAIA